MFVVGSLALILEKHSLQLDEYEQVNGSSSKIDLVKESLRQSIGGETHNPRTGYGNLNALSWEQNIENSLS